MTEVRVRLEATVYLIDDDQNMLDFLEPLVASVGMRARSFQSAEDFLGAYQRAGPACLVTDIRMPGINGLELRQQLKARGIAIPTIVMTAFADVRLAVDAMKDGAVEFLEKPFRPHDFCEAVQHAIRLDQHQWRQAAAAAEKDSRLKRLSPAERQVLDRILAGKTNRAIAEELNLSLRAIEDRRSRIMKKLGVVTRIDLLKMATGPATPISPDSSAADLPADNARAAPSDPPAA